MKDNFEVLKRSDDTINIYRRFLFSKNILIGDENPSPSRNQVALAYGLAKKFGILVDKGLEYATIDCIRDAAVFLGQYVPEPFYKGFPQSVYKLGPSELFFDQLYNYFNTYFLGNFDEERYSIFEEEVKREALNEKGIERHFIIVTAEKAQNLLCEGIENLLKSTRPLNEGDYNLVKSFINDFNYKPLSCASHNTAIKLLCDTKDTYYFEKFLNLSDVLKVLEYINIHIYKNTNLKKLNLKNQDRVFLRKILKIALNNCSFDQIKQAAEKRKIWNGFLHHIHFRSNDPSDEYFFEAMRGKTNISYLSTFENLMKEDVVKAAYFLKSKKGSSFLLRNLNYIVSRASDKQVPEIINEISGASNPIVLLQLYLQYNSYVSSGARTFKFTKNYKMKSHTETVDEEKRRKSIISEDKIVLLKDAIYKLLESAYKKKQLGKVFIDPDMKKIALPIQETTASSGYGVLPKGSRVPLNGKSLRAFTYWERVNDIDLSSHAISKDGKYLGEYSWRTNALFNGSIGKQKGITFSGDCTTGYDGGSEYFDIELDRFKAALPDAKYLVFANNVFSGIGFNNCVCNAGFMLREDLTKGKIFEPKTVKTSFAITSESNYAYLFAIDLETDEMIWLNLAVNDDSIIAGDRLGIERINPYLTLSEKFNLYDMFSMMATEVVSSMDEADMIISDGEISEENKNKTLIRSCDVEKVIALMN